MRILSPLILIPAALFAAAPASGQDAESDAREVLEDPRLRGLMESARTDPGDAVDEVANDPDSAVQEATRIFQEAQKKLDTPENRARARELADSAASRVEEMAASEKEPEAETTRETAENAPEAAEANPPAESGATAEAPAKPERVPATRSAATTTEVATPVAMPIGEDSAPLAADTPPEPVRQSSRVKPLPNVGPTEPSIPDSPYFAEAAVPEPKPLQPRFPNRQPLRPTSENGREYMEIRARESSLDSKQGILTFRGRVEVDHPDYDLDCEKLEIQLSGPIGANEGESVSQTIKRAIATGGMVKIERIGEDGAVQVAFARKADYDATKQEFILSGGPPHIQAGDRSVKTTSQDSQIILRNDGTHEIIGSDTGSQGGRNTITIPVPKNSTNGDPGLGGALGGSLDQLR